MRKLFLLVISFLVAGIVRPGMAADIEFSASAPQEVGMGERFQVTYQVNARPSDFAAPSFEGFRRVSGPSQSSSTSMQLINGQMTTTTSFSYTYVLEAGREEGQFGISPARITVDGKSYQSNRLTITVREGARAQSPSPRTQTPQPQESITPQDIFIRATANNTSPYQGEQVIVTYNIYTRLNISQYSIDRLPAYRGFWSENITAQGQPQTRTQVIDGQTYRVAEIYRTAIFPQRSGEITLEPLEAEVLVNVRGQRRQSLFDEFFGGSPFDQRRSVRENIRSNALTFNVKPLPSQNRPATFTGMVGTDFSVEASINQTELEVNDAVNFTVSITGKGNMRMTDKPAIHFPANLEVFDPNVSDNIRNTSSGVSGTRTFDYVMIPRTGGEFVIPAYQFVYFNPQTGRYVSRETSEFVLQVCGESTLAGPGALSQESIRLLGTDIRYIRTGHINLLPAGESFYASRMFWAMVILPFVLFGIFIVVWRKQIKLQSDQRLLRNKKAEKLARKRLKMAKRYLDKKHENEFYDEIFRALWGYLSDKLSIPVSILNKENVEGAFKAKQVSQQLSDNFIQTLNDCEFARFAPGPKEDRMTEIYQIALDTIVTIEKEIRNK